MNSNSVIAKTFGGLSAKSYFRHFVFGLAISLFSFSSLGNVEPVFFSITFIVVNTFLYPYSRFVYERVVSFIMGENVFFVNAIMMLFVKLFTMILCWSCSVFVAPIGLVYLYFHHSKLS